MQQTRPAEKLISLRDLWDHFLENKKWFILSIITALSFAFIYIIITPSVYTRSTSVLIKDNSKGNSYTNKSIEDFSDFGLFNTNTNIKNEVHVMHSPLLIETVIRNLKLQHNYSVKYKSVRMVDLYNATPVIVESDSILDNTSMSFTIDLQDNNTVLLSDFVLNENDLDGEVVAKLSEKTETPCGIITVIPHSEGSSYTTIYYQKQKIRSAVKTYSSILNVKQSDDDASIINLSITDIVPQRAEDFLNSLISVYNENWIKDKNQIMVSTSDFIDKQLSVIELELGGIDQQISKYKSENLLPNVETVANMYLSQVGATNEKLVLLNNQLSMGEYILSYLNDMGDQDRLLPANTGIDNGGIENQIGKYNELFLQRNSLRSNSGEQNPLIVDMNESLKAMRDMVIRSVGDYITTLNIQIKNTRLEEKQTNQKIATSPNQANYLLSIERQQQIKHALYLFMLQKRAENDLTQAFTAYNTRVINPPNGSDLPTAPQRFLILAIALLFGVLVPSLFLYILKNLNTTVQNKEDLSVLDIPLVGEIPLAQTQRNKAFSLSSGKGHSYQLSIVIEERSKNIINEAFRIVRTNIDFIIGQRKQSTVLMTTSLHPASGKTFTSLNLALSMALKGAKVIILDIDMRRASLSSIVNYPKKGLSNFLNGDVVEKSTIITKSTLHKNLDIIPSGTIPPNPSELLLKDNFEKLISELRLEYDYIFCDSPPIGLVTDASIIGKLSDVTLFIIRAGLMDCRMLPEIEEIYASKQFKNMSLILNGLKYDGNKYGYKNYGYYYSK